MLNQRHHLYFQVKQSKFIEVKRAHTNTNSRKIIIVITLKLFTKKSPFCCLTYRRTEIMEISSFNPMILHPVVYLLNNNTISLSTNTANVQRLRKIIDKISIGKTENWFSSVSCLLLTFYHNEYWVYCLCRQSREQVLVTKLHGVKSRAPNRSPITTTGHFYNCKTIFWVIDRFQEDPETPFLWIFPR